MNDDQPRDTRETVIVEKDKPSGPNIGAIVAIILVLLVLFFLVVMNPFSGSGGDGGETKINVDAPAVPTTGEGQAPNPSQ